MKTRITLIAIILLLSACSNVSKYAIDDKPVTKTDPTLLGSWSVTEDTDKHDFIFIQQPEDLANTLLLHRNDPRHDSMMRAVFAVSSTDSFENAFYEEHIGNYRKEQGYKYYVTYFDNNGTNPHYQQWDASVSKIGNETFLNFHYHDSAFQGYSFVRIISQSTTSMTVAKVADTTLRHLKSSKEVRNLFERNVYKPSFYKDTMHLYRINDYHARIGLAADMAKGAK